MIEKGKISALQFGMLAFLIPGATAPLIIPAVMAKYAKQDLWLSPIWASLSGFLLVYVTHQLHKNYPGKTIIEYLELILGRFFGKVIGFFYVITLLYVSGWVIRQYGEFLHNTFLIRTPIIVIIGSILAVSAFAVSGGIEVVARCANVFTPPYLFLLVLLVLLLIPQMNPLYLFPIMEKGIIPSLKGSIVAHGWFVSFFFISCLLPFVSDKKNSMKSGMISVSILMM